ncbi:hypothetical protein QTO34_013991 [Cnephaeus nilssonii]|uniref:Uncharacterized protein n=1 Tax=Cnephaeus nilssonii TaxID=3371016 RepID=A0AA40I923_CNENI|nr:hypothetical protein QTO34_013991 [Eptesicus nilssonii]
MPCSTPSQGRKPLFEARALGRDPQLALSPGSTHGQGRKPLAKARALGRDPQLSPMARLHPSQGCKPLAEAWALGRDPQLAPITTGDPSWFQWPSSAPSQCHKPLFEARVLARDPQLARITCRGPQLALIACGGLQLPPIFPLILGSNCPLPTMAALGGCSHLGWVYLHIASDWLVGVAGQLHLRRCQGSKGICSVNGVPLADSSIELPTLFELRCTGAGISRSGVAPSQGSGSSPATCRFTHYFVLCRINAHSRLEPGELAVIGCTSFHGDCLTLTKVTKTKLKMYEHFNNKALTMGAITAMQLTSLMLLPMLCLHDHPGPW